MNEVPEISARVEEARSWLGFYKEECGKSLSELGLVLDIDKSMVSKFLSGTYPGNVDKIAEKALSYRDRLIEAERMATLARQQPDWYDTRTSRIMTNFLHYAQQGEIVLIITPPGVGKTKVAEQFAPSSPNVWLATVSPTTSRIGPMLGVVAKAIGLGDVRGKANDVSERICEHFSGRDGLLIIDEVQELTEKAFNEIRRWHDHTGVGIAFFGNDEVLNHFDRRNPKLAQIWSRVSVTHEQKASHPEDIDACLDAWGIEGKAERDLLHRIGRHAGALREVTKTIKMAIVMATTTGGGITVEMLEEAVRRRNTRVGKW